VLLIAESRIALSAIRQEMDFVWRTGQQIAPAELLAKEPPRKWRIWRE
jgi:hypothetical protein